MSIVNWEDVSGKYPSIARDYTAETVNSHYIPYAEAELNGLLSGAYTVPFSSNNLTARELVTDLTYCRVIGNKAGEQNEYCKAVYDRIMRIKNGSEAMLTSSGDVMNIDGTIVWSTTKDYHPVFGVSDETLQVVDSNWISNEESERGHF